MVGECSGYCIGNYTALTETLVLHKNFHTVFRKCSENTCNIIPSGAVFAGFPH